MLTLTDVMWEPEVDWRKDAACNGVSSDIFFPASEEPPAAARAKEICAECPAMDACLPYALSTHPAAGVWGGLDANERRRLRRRLRDRERRKAS